MKGLYRYLSPFTPDQSGAVSVLFELGGIVVICDAGGCAGNVCGFDEPRFTKKRSAVFSACLRDMDAIMGRDDKLVEKIKNALKSYKAEFAAVIGTPVPSVIGTDYNALRRMIENRCGLPAVCIDTNGMETYDKGEEKAYMALIHTFAENQKEQKDNNEKTAGIWGATPLELAASDSAELLLGRISASGIKAVTYGMDSSIEDIKKCVSVEKNYVVSPSGLKPAEYLKEKYGIPYEVISPLNDILPQSLRMLKGNVLIIHQQFMANSIRNIIRKNTDSPAVDTATFFSFEKNYAESGDIKISEEDEFVKLVHERKYAAVIADPVFMRAIPDFSGIFISLPHFAVSGQLYAPECEADFIGSVKL